MREQVALELVELLSPRLAKVLRKLEFDVDCLESLNELTSEKLVVKGMVVGSPTTARATPRTRVRAGWFWSPHWGLGDAIGVLSVPSADFRAMCAYRRLRSCPYPPPWGGRSPPYPPAGGGNALWFLTRRGYLHPGPTALDCYLARREDKSDAETTFSDVSSLSSLRD